MRSLYVLLPRPSRWIIAVSAIVAFAVALGPASYAQTGPGGVGTDDGSSDLQLWIRADELGLTEGDFITTWPDASGNGHDASQGNTDRQPIYRSSGRNGRPTAEFGGPDSQDGTFTQADADEMNGTFSSLTSGPATYFAVGNNVAVSPDDGGSGAGQGRRALAAFWNDNTDDTDNWLWIENSNINFYDGATQFRGGSISQGDFVLYDVTHEGTTIDGRLFGDQVIDETNAESSGARNVYRLGNDRTGGDNLDGNLAEVVFFDRVLNEAERLVVQNYLSSKYAIPFATASNDKYDYDTVYSYDVAGIGQATDGSTQLASNSSIIEFSTASFSANDQYVFTGHDNADASSFGFESNEPVNGLSSNVERMERAWRIDLSNLTSKTVTISIEGSDLPTRSDSGYEYLLFVDSGDAFNTNPVAYTLQDDGSGTFTADVTLSDGDYVTIGAGQRTVSLTETTASAFENTTATPNASLTVELNLPYSTSTGTDVEVSFTGAGAGSFPASASDYSIDTTSPVTISAGSETASIDITLNNDGDVEQTEQFEVALDAAGTTNAGLGTDDTALFSILDDDDPRKLSFTNPSVSQSEGSGGGTRVETFTVEMPSSEEAATTAPLTTVDFEITSASTATAGDDITIVNESDPGGDAEYQERLSTTTGRIHFSSASNTTTAELKLEINEDDISENDEDVVIQLANPVSSALAFSGTELTYTLTNDETPPTVQFAAGTSEGDESVDGIIDVTLSAPAGNTVSVDFALDSGASTATQGSDFSLLPSGNTVTFAPGSTSESITVDVVDDSQPELDEEVAIDLSTATNATIGPLQSHTYTIRDNEETLGSTGPGGVGRTDGTGALVLWMNADNITGLNDNDPVETWRDASGYGNDASQSNSAQRPVYQSSGRNGVPTVEFGGPDSGTFDNTADVMSGSINPASDNVATYFAAGNNDAVTSPGSGNGGSNARRALAAFQGTNTDGWLFAVQDDDVQFYDGSTVESGGSITGGEFVVFDVEHNGSNVDGQLNGSSVISASGADPSGSIDAYLLGNDFTGGDNLDGNLGDVIFFDAALNTTQRTIVQNYLSAKYDVDLNTAPTPPNGALDVYAGDTGGNGDYDRGVFGIGRESASDFHVVAETDGLRFERVTGLSNDDYLLAGYAVADNTVNSSDIGGVSGLDARMDRDWYWDTNGSSPTVDVVFDLSKAGFPSVLNPDPSNYVLLYRSGTSGNWSEVSSPATVDNTDQVTFSGINAGTNGDGYYTLGTTDRADSPISGTAITIVGNSGDEGDATVGELGGDAGWRMIGPPVDGATAGDLISGSDTNGSVIEFTVAQGSMFYGWDDTADNGSDPDGDWSPINTSSTAFQNGRGYLLFLFDDEGIPDADPLNPSITIDVATGTVPSSSSNVIVGDGTPASDPVLNQDAALHVLANPFNEPYDLTSLEDGNGNSLDSNSDFQSVIQIWDGGATSAEDNAQVGSYVTATVNGTASQDGTGNMVLQSGSDVISAWQGFVVERTTPGSGPTQFTFNTTGITTGERRIVGSKSTAPVPFVRVPLKLTVSSAEGQQIARDEAASIYFHPDASNGWDALDASKLTPLTRRYALLGPVGAMRDAESAPSMKAQESRSASVEDVVTVPLALETGGEVRGQATVEIPDWSDVPDAWSLTLIDTNGTPDPGDDTEQPLTRTSSYAFAIDATAKQGAQVSPGMQTADDGARSPLAPPRLDALMRTGADGAAKSDATSSPRFALRIETGGALPVEYGRFDASTSERRVALRWETTRETNNDGFYVEHQRLSPTDSTTAPGAWASLGFVEGATQAERGQAYQFDTPELDYGTHAFRLRQVDVDGTTAFSKTLRTRVRLDEAVSVEAPYPNPVRQNATLSLTVRDQQPVRIQLYDVLGRRVGTIMDEELPAQETHTLQIDAQRLASGVYFLRIVGDDFATTQRMTVVK